ncbi:peroxiredoxin-like family protein [Chitinimonas sp.]|uniref:peroxiredoxin-like family protein n=1 Tax=Chitinimonas sp. TaxID=1934313 RepID=UPI002F955012
MQRLEDELQACKQRLLAELPATVRERYYAALAEIDASLVLARALAVGQQAPDWTLDDDQGRPVRLRDALARGPVILHFFRGGWCPYCNIALRAFQPLLPRFHQLGASLYAISPQLPEQNRAQATQCELYYPLLSDVGNAVAQAYGVSFSLPASMQGLMQGFGIDLAHFNGDASWQLPMPACYLLAQDGRVQTRFLNADYSRRVEPLDMLFALKTMVAPA